MKISELSIRRPVSTLMIVMIILILGGISFGRLNVDLLPDINFPIAIVATEYSGAGPKEVESIVTKNIENVMAMVNNVKSIRSISSEGSSMVIVEFTSGTNMDFATLDMREKLDLIKKMLPSGVGSPTVLKINPNMIPVMTLAVSSDGKEQEEVTNWVEDTLKPRLERIDGVASLNISGEKQSEVKVTVDQDKLSANGLSMAQIINTLRMENINAPGGIINDGKYDVLVRTTGEFKSLQDIENVPVMTQSGTTFLLKDIADIEEGVKENKLYSRVSSRDSITLSIQKESTANTVRVSQRVNDEIKKISEAYGDISITPIIDQADFINQSINSVRNNAIMGGILAVLILLLFLKDARATTVIAVSIPISVIATFILVYFSGITLNMISLGGLALGVGMLVDNSIVVLENIYRMRKEGKSRMEAARDGSSQVTMAIVASTLTTVCVFLPVIFVQGITAEIFKQMALTVTFSLLASLVVALTLVPMVSSRILSDRDINKTNKTVEKIKVFYGRILYWALNHRAAIAVITLVIFSGSLGLLKITGTEFFPNMDQGYISVTVKMPRGTNYEETVKQVQEVEGIIGSIKEVDTIASSIGGGQMALSLNGQSTDTGNIDILLKPLNKRKRSAEQIGDEIRSRTQKIPGCRIEVNSGGSLMMGQSLAQIEIEIKGDDLNSLKNISDDVVKKVREVQGTREVKSSYEKGASELAITLDRDKGAQYGLSTALISQAIQSQLKGTAATRYKVGGEEIDVTVQTDPQRNIGIKEIDNMIIQTPIGISIPLKSVAEIAYEDGYVNITRKNQVRYMTVSSSVSGRDVGSVTKDIQEKLKNYQLPKGYSIFYGGENQQITEAFSDLSLALVLAVILVYMVMASQFESLFEPFIIMFTIPLAFTGGFIALFLTGKPLSVPAILGMLILAGIVVNNGIVLVDYINTLRKGGMERNESILRAGPTRLQPILMTTLTTILGLIPLALGIGEGAETEMPLAVTVIGGLTLSTILTLVVVPVIYTLMDDLGHKFRRKKSVTVV